MNTPSPQLAAALKLYINELSTHYAFLQKFVLETTKDPARIDAAADEALAAERKSIERRFHLIKGGAGFFSLQAIRELSARGEQLFRQNLCRGDYRALLLGEFSNILDALQRECAALTAPGHPED